MSTELPRRQRATGTRAKICIVASEYNEQYTQALVENCSEELKTVLPSVRLEIIRVPGAFEIPVAIKSVLSRSPEKRPDAVVALGVILRGSTDHADLIGSTITQALMQLALEFTTPVIHEVLLLNDEKQAFARCIASQLNRGREAAAPLPAWRNSSSTPCSGNNTYYSLLSIAMLSRNQIRQAALQYLYAASQTPETEREGIWDILMEPFRGDYCKLKAKAVSGHLTRDYPDKLRLFITRARETADKLQQDPLTLPVRDQLQDLLAKEGEFNASLLRLKKALHEDPSNDRGSLSAACDAAQGLNTALMQMRRRLLDTLKDFPAYNAIWPSLISSCSKLQEINDRINCLIHPDDRPSLAEIKKVVEAGRDAEELYREAKTLGEDILRRRDGLDAAIDSTLENYSPERVSAIDRAILRLGAYELLHRKDLPAPIVISEAIRLSERFSSAESPRFINGVLAGISKTGRPA